MSAFFAEHDAGAQVRACAVALSRIAELTAQPEALAALAHALAETTRLDAGPGAAAAEFLRSVELFGPLGLPLATATRSAGRLRSCSRPGIRSEACGCSPPRTRRIGWTPARSAPGCGRRWLLGRRVTG